MTENVDVQSLLTGQPEFVSRLRGGFIEQLEILLGAEVLQQHGVTTPDVIEAALIAFDSIPFQEDNVEGYAESALKAAVSVVEPVIDAVGKQVAARLAEIDLWEKRQRDFDEFCRMETPKRVQ